MRLLPGKLRRRGAFARNIRRAGLFTRYLISVFSVILFVLVAVPLITKEPANGTATTTSAARIVAPKPAPKPAPKSTPPKPDRFYRWRDANGQIHYHSTPPPASVGAEEVPFVRRSPAPEPVAEPEAVPSMPHRNIEWKGLLSVYTPEGMAELKEAVEQTAKRLGERNQRLDELQDMLKRREPTP